MDLTPTEIVRCAVLYYANTRPLEQLQAAAGHGADTHPRYLDEKCEDYHRGMSTWFSRFDAARQERWVAAAIARYGIEVIIERVYYSAETNDRAESAEGQG